MVKRRLLPIINIIYHGFKEYQIQLSAATLTYYTLLSLVPIFTLFLIVAKNFALEENMQRWLLHFFKDQSDVSNYLISFAHNALEKTETMEVKLVGLAILIWAAIKMLLYIDVGINRLWNKPVKPKLLKRYLRFVVMLFVCPLLFLLTSGFTFYFMLLINYMSSYGTVLEDIERMILVISNIFPSLITFLLLSFLYYFVPYVKVKLKHALSAGLMTAVGYQLIQYAYFSLQVSVASYNAIYGTFAAFPLFLVWLHLSWIIFLIGGKLCFSFSHRQELSS